MIRRIIIQNIECRLHYILVDTNDVCDGIINLVNRNAKPLRTSITCARLIENNIALS
jgi:hypothetical protein